MLDFLMISTRTKRGVVEIYPKFIIKKSKDLMIRGGDFYAIWMEDKGLWSTNEEDVIEIIDNELLKFAKANKTRFGDDHVKILHMWDAETGIIDKWHRYCQRQLRDNYIPLDENLIFLNDEPKKEYYGSKRLPYSLDEGGSIEAFDTLIGTLYSEEERHKIEWIIGSIVTGDSKDIQKFGVLYGPPGSGKSTILNVIQKLFEGYYSMFDAESLGSANDAFALEQFRHNPLVAISHDGDLSRIEKNTRLNSLVSHEQMVVNEKHKSTYAMRFNSFLLMGTNRPVKITDAKSGLLRRLIDIHPSGKKLPVKKYNRIMNQIEFELGAIAHHCKMIYLEDPTFYDLYTPVSMMGESNDFYNFILDSHTVFRTEDGVTLKAAWEMYKVYCEEARVPYPFTMRIFKSELRNYFNHYDERIKIGDDWVRSYYSGFKADIFDNNKSELLTPVPADVKPQLIEFMRQPSKLDISCADCPAQYGTAAGIPQRKWDEVETTLKDLDTSELHYLRVPDNHIVIDFDITDEDGNKSFDLNLKEASKWPKTYAEVSRSGGGIHLHYIYNGDPTQLSRIYADSIEIKVFTGKSSLRRQLSINNNEDIATISSGLPVRGDDKKVVNFEAISNEKALRTIIRKNINKEYHPATKPSVDFIFKSLNDAYESGMHYDVTDLQGIILAFAASSTNQSDYCVRLVSQMKLKSDDISTRLDTEEEIPIVFYDIEVFPNLFVLNWKIQGEGRSITRMINPNPKEVEQLLQYRLVGFNCRRYDNHILYGALLGYSNLQLYDLSQKIINGKRAFFGEAYNLSYTDIYDYTTKKQSLKKWQIELGIHHQELGLPWDEPVPEELWPKVAEYCDNDVISTEAVWNHTQGDFRARQILAELAGMSVNDTSNSITTKLIFGSEKNPELVYTDLSETFPGYEFVKVWNDQTQKFDMSNMYRGIDLGFGGYVEAEPGIYGNVAVLDIESMHPRSAILMNMFGKYTRNFADIVDTRLHIKHGEIDIVRGLFGGRLKPYLNEPELISALSNALKIPINSVYGLTSARFNNIFRDPRNENNIVALRGALFMKTLRDEVVNRGYKVIHIKTDSIKIADATPEIIEYCVQFAKDYGYSFQHEATYEKIALVNDAVFVAKLDKGGYLDKGGRGAGEWTATGTQFKVPYVFKKLFSKEDIVFDDLTEVKESRKGAIYLHMGETPEINEENLQFIGRVGSFCPIKEDCGGGTLVRPVDKRDGSVGYDSVIGTKGYKWLESSYVLDNQMEDCIDISYYNKMVDSAVETISSFGDFEWFVSDDPYIPSINSN